MVHSSFDARMTLNGHHLETAGLSDRRAVGVGAVREAVGGMD
jgi:hypothetical protein